MNDDESEGNGNFIGYEPIFFEIKECVDDYHPPMNFTLRQGQQLELNETDDAADTGVDADAEATAYHVDDDADTIDLSMGRSIACHGQDTDTNGSAALADTGKMRAIMAHLNAHLRHAYMHALRVTSGVHSVASELTLFTLDRLRSTMERHYYQPLASAELAFLGGCTNEAGDDAATVHTKAFLEHGYMQCGRNLGFLSFSERYVLQNMISASSRVRARSGDVAVSVAVASPPEFLLDSTCNACNQSFSLLSFRHHCRNCGGSFCSAHSNRRRRLPHFGLIMPVRVCLDCETLLLEEEHRQWHLWRSLRTKAFLNGELERHCTLQLDSAHEKALRLAKGVLDVARGALSLTLPSKLLIESAEVVLQMGWTGLAGLALRKDFLDAVRILAAAADLENVEVKLSDITACVYYKLAIDRGRRGRYPMQELHDHAESGSTPVSASDLSKAIRLAPLALVAVYQERIEDIERIAASQGWKTIFGKLDSLPEEPAYAVFATNRHERTQEQEQEPDQKQVQVPSDLKEVLVCIRGTKTIEDVVTDIRSTPQSFPPPKEEVSAAWEGKISSSKEAAKPKSPAGTGKACRGVSKSALWLLGQLAPVLLQLHNKGYHVLISGHSLGGAVASLLTHLVQQRIPAVQCVTYGSPACVDEEIARALEASCVSIVLRDDAIPRITPISIRGLVKDLVSLREEVSSHLSEDFAAVIHRASTLWSPRARKVETSASADYSSYNKPSACIEAEPQQEEDEDGFLVVEKEEEHCMSFWLPGRVMHIYSLHGQYQIGTVRRDFPPLRRIDMHGDMFEDHRAKSMFDALLGVRAVRSSATSAPPWQSYTTSEVCSCCSSRFSWHSTFRSEAQGFRDKHNCRMCGRLCCGPCSTQRRSIPTMGLLHPVRICDKCFYRGDFAAL